LDYWLEYYLAKTSMCDIRQEQEALFRLDQVKKNFIQLTKGQKFSIREKTLKD